VRDLRVDFETNDGSVAAVKGIDLDVFASRDRRDRRRVGLGQEPGDDGDHGAARGERPGDRLGRYRGEEILGLPSAS
jgi:hypothetical protein